LTPGRPSSPACLWWLRHPDRLLFTECKNGGVAISVLHANGQAETLWSGDETIGTGPYGLTLSIADDGTTSSIMRCSWSQPREVWSGPIGRWKQRTRINSGLKPLWGRTERVEWSSDGHSVQGWLLYPYEFNPAHRYPLIVSAHGGPAAQRAPSWPDYGGDITLMAAHGYFVFFPNPRGSYGKGEAFTAANVKDFGHGDLRDILAGLDQVLRQAPVDPNRIGIGGHSYGGYMTMWAVTQTRRFRAAIAGAGIANWQSYYGQNLISQWLIPYFGASVYDDPKVYARSSPIEFIRQAATPTLIIAGERDKACPAAQSYEFWRALKAVGVKTKLVVYAGEGHRLHKPANVEDLAKRMIAWFNENLAG
jgi:dipeptidyl aminopeptidase/acylaminoacyl peptidase